MWGNVLLGFWFAFYLWLVILSIFLYTCCLLYIFGKESIHILCPIFNQIVWGFFAIKLYDFYYILDINSSSDKWFASIFTHFISCLVILLMVCFAMQKLLVWCSPTCWFFLLLSLLWYQFQNSIAKTLKNLKNIPCALEKKV